MKCLMLYIPLLIGDKVNESSDYWDLLLQILDIFKVVSAPRISKAATYLLKAKIEEHHRLFLQLFPDRRLTPKQHNLVHYPRAIRFLGPLGLYSVMRMEAKHKQLKKWAKLTHNYRNIAKTLAQRHQQAQGFEFLMKQQIDSHTEDIGAQMVVQASSLTNAEQVCTALNCPPEQEIVVINTVNLSGYIYRANVMVLCKWDDEPEFASIEQVVMRESAVKLIVKPWTTLYYDQHYSAYAVKASDHHFQVWAPEDLVDHKPLPAVKNYDTSNPVWFVVTRFKLC